MTIATLRSVCHKSHAPRIDILQSKYPRKTIPQAHIKPQSRRFIKNNFSAAQREKKGAAPGYYQLISARPRAAAIPLISNSPGAAVLYSRSLHSTRPLQQALICPLAAPGLARGIALCGLHNGLYVSGNTYIRTAAARWRSYTPDIHFSPARCLSAVRVLPLCAPDAYLGFPRTRRRALLRPCGALYIFYLSPRV